MPLLQVIDFPGSIDYRTHPSATSNHESFKGTVAIALGIGELRQVDLES